MNVLLVKVKVTVTDQIPLMGGHTFRNSEFAETFICHTV